MRRLAKKKVEKMKRRLSADEAKFLYEHGLIDKHLTYDWCIINKCSIENSFIRHRAERLMYLFIETLGMFTLIFIINTLASIDGSVLFSQVLGVVCVMTIFYILYKANHEEDIFTKDINDLIETLRYGTFQFRGLLDNPTLMARYYDFGSPLGTLRHTRVTYPKIHGLNADCLINPREWFINKAESILTDLGARLIRAEREFDVSSSQANIMRDFFKSSHVVFCQWGLCTENQGKWLGDISKVN
jgi:uncharacterized membrane protein